MGHKLKKRLIKPPYKDLNKKESEYLKLLQINQEDSEMHRKWINEYTKNMKDPLYLTIMNVLTIAFPRDI